MKHLLLLPIFLIPFNTLIINAKTTNASLTKKVLIIGIDGCRGDALAAANTPNIDALAANGSYNYDGVTESITSSGPGWASILTGVWDEKHQVSDNSFFGNDFSTYPHFFRRIEDFDSDLHTVSIAQWHPINNSIADDHADVTINVDDHTDFVRDAAVDYLTNNDPDVLFVHFDDVDHAGHSYGFSINVPEYKTAIETVDGGIGPIIAAINSRPNISSEDWIIILVPDHGGLGTSHGGTSVEENNVFFIVSGDKVPNQVLSPIPTTTTVAASALNFDGADDYAQVPNNTVYDFGSSGDFTIEAWVKTAGWSGDPMIVTDKNWVSGNFDGFIIAADDDGERWLFNAGDGLFRIDIEGGVINDNVWHHLAISFDRSGQLNLFQDGELLSQVSESFTGDINTSRPLSFGWDGSYGDKFTGNIAEVRIWNAALGKEAIADWACQGVTASHPNYSNLIGYWKMDEGSGTNLADASPSANNAMAYGSPTWVNAGETLTCYDISEVPGLADVAPTTMEHLCIPIDPAWGMDGQARGVTACPPCPVAGTPCDDGNAGTENDQEDGNCLCEGTPIHPIRKVLVIGIDGCRGDALAAANTPNIDALAANGSYSYDAITESITSSGPGWASILTGVWDEKHLVSDNSFSGNDFATYPHFFKRIEDFDSELHTVSIAQWHPINDNIAAPHADVTINVDDHTNYVRDAAVDYLTNHDPDVLFVHFDDVDHAGHSDGFSIDVPEYKAAIETVDSGIGPIIAAINNRSSIANEDWIIIVVPDHGGLGTSHGGTSPEENNVFFIVSGDNVTNQVLSPTVTQTTITSSVINFDGSDDYLQVPDNPIFDFGTSQDFTIEVWVKTAGWSGDPIIVSDKDWDSGIFKGFVIAAQTDGQTWKFNAGDGSNRIDINGGVINDNEWHHLAISWYRNGQLNLFQDGELISQISSSFTGDISTSLPLSFGWDGDYSDVFSGHIAEVRIWNTQLTNQVITDWACQRLTASHPNYLNLLGYWKMDEGSGTTLSDASPGGNPATAFGSPAWVNPGGTLTCYDISEVPSLADVASTTLEHLCIPIDLDWNLDGTARGVSACGPCPPAGTACDDGDPCTANDRYDGACNCTGNYADANSLNCPILPVSVKVFLQGPYDNGLMNDDLRANNYLSSVEPYSDLGFTQVNSGYAFAAPAALQVTGDDAIVDWVFLELRDKDTPSLVVATISALLQRDGDVVAEDGCSPAVFLGAAAGEYYLAIRHRNHLGARTANTFSFGPTGASIDFTSPSMPTLGTDAQVNLGGVFALWSGDANTDNTIDALDRGETWNNRNQTGYLRADVNLDGVCDALDRGVTWNNRNLECGWCD